MIDALELDACMRDAAWSKDRLLVALSMVPRTEHFVRRNKSTLTQRIAKMGPAFSYNWGIDSNPPSWTIFKECCAEKSELIAGVTARIICTPTMPHNWSAQCMIATDPACPPTPAAIGWQR